MSGIDLPDTYTDKRIKVCIRKSRSFAVIAGAGSGKTTSLRKVMELIRSIYGPAMRSAGQRVACITYTNRAVAVIQGRLGLDEFFLVSTLNGFLWGEIKQFQREIRATVISHLIPARITKKQTDDNGGASKKARNARKRVHELNVDLNYLRQTGVDFTYEETGGGSRFSKGRLDHDDVVDLFAMMIGQYPVLRMIIGQKYPYIFVDEAQDTFPAVMNALNQITQANGLPLIGYFGDPMQQIYDDRAGKFNGPSGSAIITKPENYRCSTEVIRLLNLFRSDLQQTPGVNNQTGSVEVRLVLAEAPAQVSPRGRRSYSEDQITRAIQKFDAAVNHFGWTDDNKVKKLFLVRQMIARRLGFTNIHRTFTSDYISLSAKSDYEEGKHYLLLPFIKVLWPLMIATDTGDRAAAYRILRQESPLLDPNGENSTSTLAEIALKVEAAVKAVSSVWSTATMGTILRVAASQRLLKVSDRLEEQLSRSPRTETYDEELHALDKGDWLADEFFKLTSAEIPQYVDFTQKETAFSTQHGVKGEEFGRVMVLFDDTEANWTNYNFSKLFTPQTAGGEPTEGQRDKGMKLAYVCFSRAERDLRIIFFTTNPSASKSELISRGLFRPEQISLQI